MKKIYLLVLIFPFLACASTTRLDTPEEFGREIIRCLNDDKKDELISLVITKVQFDALIESFDNTDEQKNSYKSILTPESLVEVEQNIIKGYENYRKILAENKSSASTIEKITDKTGPMKVIPFQMGKIEIEFSVEKRKYVLSIESIKSLEGWKIMDDFHIYEIT